MHHKLNLFLRYFLPEDIRYFWYFCLCECKVIHISPFSFRKCTRATGRSRGKRASSCVWTLSLYSPPKAKQTSPVLWVILKTVCNIWIFLNCNLNLNICRKVGARRKKGFYGMIKFTNILSSCRSNTRKSMRKTKARWLALSQSVMTLRWPTLLWPPSYRVTATTRRNMRTLRPSTGEAVALMGPSW